MTAGNSLWWFKTLSTSAVCFLASVEGYHSHSKGIKKQPVPTWATPMHRASNSLNCLWKDAETLACKLDQLRQAGCFLAASMAAVTTSSRRLFRSAGPSSPEPLQLLTQRTWFRACRPHPPQQKLLCGQGACYTGCCIFCCSVLPYKIIQNKKRKVT